MLQFHPVTPADAPALADLRADAMRPSLERVGRFDLDRARARLLDHFNPAQTTAIEYANQRVGFFVLDAPAEDGSVYIRHLYLGPAASGQGIGSQVMLRLCAAADAGGYALTLGALLESDANRFYQRHGFVETHRDAFDIYYRREPRSA